MSKTFSSAPKVPIKRILYTLENKILIGPEEINILIGISGGQDSTCLSMFLMIYQRIIKTKKSIRIGLVYCQHNWTTNSIEMSNHIDSWVTQMRKLGFKITLYSSIPVNPVTTESEGRQLRLNVFTKLAKRYNYNLIVTGHTLNDQVETFIMQQLVRGFFSPISMNSCLDNNRSKPFFDITRHEICQICLFWKFPVYADPSNQSLFIPRSRIRLELISILKAFYNPQVETSLFQNIQLQTIRDSSIKGKYFKIPLIQNAEKIVLNRTQFNFLPKWNQQIILRQCFETLGVFHIGFYWIEKSLFLLKIKKNFKFHLIESLYLEGKSSWLIISKNQN